MVFCPHFLNDSLLSWLKSLELILVTGGFCDSLRVSLEVKLVSFEFIHEILFFGKG